MHAARRQTTEINDCGWSPPAENAVMVRGPSQRCMLACTKSSRKKPRPDDRGLVLLVI
jgi:hypothetical protein